MSLCTVLWVATVVVAVAVLVWRRRTRKPTCLHWWEITSEPWVNREYPHYSDLTLHNRTYWHERCTACGELRTSNTWGKWSLEEITGERTLGVARNLPGA